MCAFQSIFWQPAPQYAATAHPEHFFSGTPVALHDQQLFLDRGGSCWEAAVKGKAAAEAATADTCGSCWEASMIKGEEAAAAIADVGA